MPQDVRPIKWLKEQENYFKKYYSVNISPKVPFKTTIIKLSDVVLILILHLINVSPSTEVVKNIKNKIKKLNKLKDQIRVIVGEEQIFKVESGFQSTLFGCPISGINIGAIEDLDILIDDMQFPVFAGLQHFLKITLRLIERTIKINEESLNRIRPNPRGQPKDDGINRLILNYSCLFRGKKPYQAEPSSHKSFENNINWEAIRKLFKYYYTYDPKKFGIFRKLANMSTANLKGNYQNYKRRKNIKDPLSFCDPIVKGFLKNPRSKAIIGTLNPYSYLFR